MTAGPRSCPPVPRITLRTPKAPPDPAVRAAATTAATDWETGPATATPPASTPPPAYPSDARRRNIEGSVLVELAIARDGSCEVRRVVESSGFVSLDEAVEKTVVQWKYRPADVDGRPESFTKRLRFTFRLSR